MSEQRVRLDKWLWHARLYKSRTLATGACSAGRIRINGTRTEKPHHALKAGDVLTFPHGPRIRVIRVVAIGSRRGPAREARLLYEDLAPAVVSEAPPEADETKSFTGS
jgi:ribosome-associated heat shock protein Hsp15